MTVLGMRLMIATATSVPATNTVNVVVCSDDSLSRSSPAHDLLHPMDCVHLRARLARKSCFESVPRLEHPRHANETKQQKGESHSEAELDADVGDAVKAPAKAADEIHHGIE